MAKNTDIQRQLDAIRGEMCALHDRRDELNAIAKERGIQRFEDANGCKRCRVLWLGCDGDAAEV